MVGSACCRPSDGPSPFTFMGFGKKFSTRKAWRKVRRALHITGKQIKPKLGIKSKSALAGVSSARGVDSIYGSTGSIVGRY